ncbi:FAD-binding PCMH-type domain-containing protein [Psidium guajava]|nr:FAD-binding PCMH-type domain-containing protein [Psidium guajava]
MPPGSALANLPSKSSAEPTLIDLTGVDDLSSEATAARSSAAPASLSPPQVPEEEGATEKETEDEGRKREGKKKIVGKKDDDDDRLYFEFEPTRGFTQVSSFESAAFRSPDHEEAFRAFLAREAIPNRYVDFEYLESHGIFVREIFEELNFKSICCLEEDVYPRVVAHFYSNLHFPNPNEFVFTFGKKDYSVNSEELASILSASSYHFEKIPIHFNDAYKAITENPSFCRGFKTPVSYHLLPLKHNIIHKILVRCIRPKATNTNIVSRYEARLLWAMVIGAEFSLPHTIILHMLRTVKRKVGKLPYGSLITKILQHKGIEVPYELKVEKLATLEIGRETLSRMNLKPTVHGWVDSKNEVMRIGDEDDEYTKLVLREKMKQAVGKSKKRKAPMIVQQMPKKRRITGESWRKEKATAEGKSSNIASEVGELRKEIRELKNSIEELARAVETLGQNLVVIEQLTD